MLSSKLHDKITTRPLESDGHSLARAYAVRLPWAIERVLGLWARKVCVAGGYLRWVMGFEDTLNDIDLFFQDAETMEAVKKYLIGSHYARVHYESRNCTTLILGEGPTFKIQLVHRWYFSPDEHILRFDFTNCQANLWRESENGEWRCNYAPSFKEDCTRKVLHYNAPEREEEPLGSMRRALRFVGRGWTIGASDFGSLCMQMHRRLSDYEELDLNENRSWLRLAFRAGCDY